MSYRNFAAQCLPDLELFANRTLGHAPVTSAFATYLGDIIREAQHFSLPDGGKLLDDNLRGLVGEEVHLPFPAITVECVNNDDSSVNEGQVFVPRRLAVAIEGERVEAMRRDVSFEGHIAVFGVSYFEGYWVPDPTGIMLRHVQEPTQDGGLISVDLFVTMPEAFEHTIARYGGKEAAFQSVKEDLNLESRAVCELLEALACSNVSTERVTQVSPAVNRKREAKGKTPLLDYHVLVVNRTGEPGEARGPIGDRASPRQHLRRGHIRRYASGRKVWINAMWVGSAERGVILKDYDTRQPA